MLNLRKKKHKEDESKVPKITGRFRASFSPVLPIHVARYSAKIQSHFQGDASYNRSAYCRRSKHFGPIVKFPALTLFILGAC